MAWEMHRDWRHQSKPYKGRFRHLRFACVTIEVESLQMVAGNCIFGDQRACVSRTIFWRLPGNRSQDRVGGRQVLRVVRVGAWRIFFESVDITENNLKFHSSLHGPWLEAGALFRMFF